MREEPPKPLVDLVERLHLATAEQVRAMSGRVRRLAQDLPLFESVWVDALAQARVLTPFQAAEINAGRGDALRVGPYVIAQSLPSLAYAACYSAREISSGRLVRLAVGAAGSPADTLSGLLTRLISASQRLRTESLAPIAAAGVESGHVWAACRHLVGPTAGEWIVHNGRFAPQCVLEIARQMLVGLTALEKQEFPHGDLGAASVVLTRDGGVVLPFPGLRGLLRPEEGYAHADLSPEGYDYLAPERVMQGTPPDIASDLYACGCFWWHLLTGRVPVPGGSSLAKLRAAETAQIADVTELAPDVPAPLAAAISACLHREPKQRPHSVGDLAERLGPPTARGSALLAACVTRPGMSPPHWAVSLRTLRQSGQAPLWLAAIGGCLVAAMALAWSIWQAGLPRFAGGTWTVRHQTASRPASPASRSSEGVPANTAERPPEVGGSRPVGPNHETRQNTAATERAASDRSPPGGIAPNASSPHVAALPDGSPAASADTLVLPQGKPIAAGSLPLRAGLCVRGESGARVVVVVPNSGFAVRPENVRFENVDFIGDQGAAPAAVSGESVLLDLQASRTEFRGCSFQSAVASSAAPAAIRWTHPVERGQLELALPSGRLRLSDCVFRHVAAAVACRTVGAVTVEIANSLHLGNGPMVQLDHAPRLDEPTAISLSSVTLRGPGPLWECRYKAIEDQPGNVTIQSDGCAFVMPGQAALLRFVGPKSPDRLLRNVQWTGQGSLVSPVAVIAQWAPPGARALTLDESAVSIAGLVRSEAAFAGPAEEGPAASRLVDWQVPLRSPNAPGIDPRRLFWPSR